ncbi:MAG TPA: hypothetical protein VG826_28850 [Pirellulales bacterium]|nr:hypothetical protein [Pirellulales bacterium]
MLRPMSTLALVMSLVAIAYPADAQAARRLAAVRAARAAAAEAAAETPPPAAMRTASVQAPVVQPAALQTIMASQPAPVAAPAGCGVCCPQPCIIYRHRGHHRACCDCAPPIETILTATDPCTCCPVAIPVCVPACCQCAPTVSCHNGLFGHGVVQYDWSCGYRVTVRFKHNGDVVVVSRG